MLSAEHAGRELPPRWAARFAGAEEVLAGHRGWDPGSLDLACSLAERTGAQLLSCTTTRLLADCNRSPDAPTVFSEFTRGLPPRERERILAICHAPHRDAVAAAVDDGLREHGRVLHLAVHSFTPIWKGRSRDVDVGLLHDPRRGPEAELCRRWRRALARRMPELRIRLNRPYRGWTDGLCTTLRTRLGGSVYAGLELEMNQLFASGPSARFEALREALADSLLELLP